MALPPLPQTSHGAISVTDRDTIIRKIQALRARAADAASTEAEAAMAARKAQELLDKHNLTMDETQVRADGVERQIWDNGKARAPCCTKALAGICEALNVTHFYSGGRISIVGAPADVAVALYYIDLVENAAWSCWATYQGTFNYRVLRRQGMTPRKIGASYRTGVAVRLGSRIAEQAALDKAQAASGSGMDLVPVKDAMQREWLAAHNIKIKDAADLKPDEAMIDGYRKGGTVPISRGVGSAHNAKPALPSQ